MSKKIVLLICILVIIIAVAAGYFLFVKESEPTIPAEPNLVGNDRDAHGCIGSAGYSWCESKQKCLRVWEEVCDEQLNEELNEMLQKLFADKYQKNIADIKITISQETPTHVRGSVKFDSTGIGEGGIFLAAKVNNQWQLVFDGNGNISCALLQQYNFPTNMMTDCAN